MPDPVLQTADVQTVATVFDRMFPKPKEEQAKAPGDEAAFEPVPESEQPDATPKPPEPKSDDGKPPVVPPKEAPPATEEPPEDLSKLSKEQRKDAWKNLRDAHKATLKDLDALRGELKDFEGTRKERDEIKARIDSLQKERDQLAEIDSIAKLEHQPQFREKYVEGRKKAVSTLTELAGYADIEPSELLATLNRTGRDRYTSLSDAIAAAPDVLKGKIVALVDQIYDLDAGRQQELSAANESLSRREQERQNQQRAQETAYEESAKKLFAHTADRLGKELALKPELIEKARVFFETNRDLGAAAEMFIKAVAADDAITEKKGMAAKIASLEKELAAFNASEPGVRSGAPEAKDDGDEKLSFIERIKKQAMNGGSGIVMV